MPGQVTAAARLIEEPDAFLGLVDPHLDQAGGGHVVLLVAERVRPRKLPISA